MNSLKKLLISERDDSSLNLSHDSPKQQNLPEFDNDVGLSSEEREKATPSKLSEPSVELKALKQVDVN